MNQDHILGIKPNNPSGIEIFTKLFLGLVIGAIIALLIFLILTMTGDLLSETVKNKSTATSSTSPMLPLILIVIGFLATVISNIIIGGSYNLFFSDKYYDSGKTFSLILTINVILFFIFSPLYILFYSDIDKLYIILAFHIGFSGFLSIASMEFITNPNYSASHIVGTSLGFTLAILIFGILYKTSNLSEADAIKILILSPCILTYLIIPVVSALWEKLYYKFYEGGNNFLYIPSIDEILVEEDEIEDINVEL